MMFLSLIKSVSECKTLTKLYFSNVELGDTGCIKLLNSISPYQIEKISLKNCGITSRSYKAFTEFLQMPPQKYTDQKKIKTIIIEGSSMTAVELDNIDYYLNGDEYEEDEVINVEESDVDSNKNLKQNIINESK